MTQDQNYELARQHLFERHSIKELAIQWGMSYQGMSQKLRSSAMAKIMRELRDEITDRVVNAQLFLHANAQDYIREIDRIARDPSHDKQTEMLRYICDMIYPKEHRHLVVSHTTHTHQLSEPVANELTSVLSALRERLGTAPITIDQSPHILEGEAAIPRPASQEDLPSDL